jgi:hypothetical protein
VQLAACANSWKLAGGARDAPLVASTGREFEEHFVSDSGNI